MRRSASIVASSDPTELFGEYMTERFIFDTGRRPNPSEVRSWKRSFPALAQDLLDAGLGDIEMQLEYKMPNNDRRADVILSGVHPRTGHDSHIVVELKQWDRATLANGSTGIVCVPQMIREPKHPVLQVRDYCRFLANHTPLFSSTQTTLTGVAYLHNAADIDVADLYEMEPDPYGRLFTKDTRGGFLAYLQSLLAPTSGALAADALAASPIKPTRKFMTQAGPIIKNREQFVLLDDQYVAYETVMRAERQSRQSDLKEVVIVTGGPGSGKSAIALQLLADMLKDERSVSLATGSRSFTQTLRRFVGKGNKRAASLFTYFNSFLRTEKNALDVLICDEAHRIRKVSSNRYTRREHVTNRPQVAELIDAARVPVFFLDEHQVVKPDEIGTVAAIEAHARAEQLKVRHVSLDGQFRCGGSKAYESWVLSLLGLQPGGPMPWHGDEDFAVHIAESPQELESAVKQHISEGETARMAAGYCWPWSDPDDGRLIPDVRISEEWAHPWNVKGPRRVGDAPPSELWATDPGGLYQVGCVYTAQGFEYDWSAVILGPDIVVENGKLITVRAENKDPAFRFKTIPDDVVDHHIRNIYKVLLTRGMRGTVIYAVDDETRKFLIDLMRDNACPRANSHHQRPLPGKVRCEHDLSLADCDRFSGMR